MTSSSASFSVAVESPETLDRSSAYFSAVIESREALDRSFKAKFSSPLQRPSFYSGTPNLGGKKLNLLAKDDANLVYMIKALDVATGKVVMPFRHPEFLAEYFRGTDLGKQFAIVALLARFRNMRLIVKINTFLAAHNIAHPDDLKTLFPITREMSDIASRIEQILTDAIALGVDARIYLDDSTDADDIAQCTNSWCMNQSKTAGKASDSVKVITDLDGVIWLVLIERKNGPGRLQAAYAGGFVDDKETFLDAAKREDSEEIDGQIEGGENVSFSVSTFPLTEIESRDWDPRVKFANGMHNGGLVTHYTFSRL